MHHRSPSSPPGEDPYTQQPTRRTRRRADRSFSGERGPYDASGDLAFSSTAGPAERDGDASSRHTWPRRTGEGLDEIDFGSLPVVGVPPAAHLRDGPSVLRPLDTRLAPALGTRFDDVISPDSVRTVESPQQPNYVGTPLPSADSHRASGVPSGGSVPAVWRRGSVVRPRPSPSESQYASDLSYHPSGAVKEIDHYAGDGGPSGQMSYILPTPRPLSPHDYRLSSALATPYEPKFRDPRLNLGMLRYTGWLPRLVYLSLPLRTAASIFAQLFLDFNALYILSLIARFPQGSSGRGGADWVAVGGYALSVFVWLFGVILGYELIYSYRRIWGREHRPPIVPLYMSAASFRLAAMRDYSYFGFLYHVRLAAWRSPNSLDGVLETLYWLLQNWPTAITLIPRLGLCCSLLLTYTDDGGDRFSSIMQRDPAFFNARGDLTNYAAIVLLVNAVWAAWRILVVAASAVLLGMFTCSGGAARALGYGGQPKRRSLLHAEDDVLSPTFSGRSTQPEETSANWAWRWRTAGRVRAAAEFCGVSMAAGSSILGQRLTRTASEDAEMVGPQMTEVTGHPSPFVYMSAESPPRGESAPISGDTERALLDDAALNAYRNSTYSERPRTVSSDHSTAHGHRPRPTPLPPGAGEDVSYDSALTAPSNIMSDDPTEQVHVVPGSPNASSVNLAGPHEVLNPSPRTLQVPRLGGDNSPTSSGGDSVRLSAMFPVAPSPGSHPTATMTADQITQLRRDIEQMSDDDDSEYARSDPSGLQAITEVTEDEESIRRRRTSSRATSTGRSRDIAPLTPSVLLTGPPATPVTPSGYDTAEEPVTPLSPGLSDAEPVEDLAQSSPYFASSPQMELTQSNRGSVAGTFGRPYSAQPPATPSLSHRSSQETF